MHERKWSRHDHRTALDSRLRFFVARFSAGQVVAHHTLVALDRINRADHATRREQHISHRAVGDEQARYAIKPSGSAFVLHHEGFQRSRLVELGGERLIGLRADGARDELHLVVFSGAPAVFDIGRKREAECERDKKRRDDRLCDATFSHVFAPRFPSN